jgi:hypothetical protein
MRRGFQQGYGSVRRHGSVAGIQGKRNIKGFGGKIKFSGKWRITAGEFPPKR